MVTDAIISSIQDFFFTNISPFINKILDFIPLNVDLSLIIISILLGIYVASKIISRVMMISIFALGIFFMLKFFGIGVGF